MSWTLTDKDGNGLYRISKQWQCFGVEYWWTPTKHHKTKEDAVAGFKPLGKYGYSLPQAVKICLDDWALRFIQSTDGLGSVFQLSEVLERHLERLTIESIGEDTNEQV